jgi:hypothetical protein
MRRTFIIVAAALLAIMPASVAVPAAASAVSARPAVTCASYFDAFWDSNTLTYAKADWESNTCNYQLRVHAQFETRFAQTQWVDSGWVEAVELNTQANTPGGTYVLDKAIAEWEPDGGGTWRNCKEFYPSVGSTYAC